MNLGGEFDTFINAVQLVAGNIIIWIIFHHLFSF